MKRASLLGWSLAWLILLAPGVVLHGDAIRNDVAVEDEDKSAPETGRWRGAGNEPSLTEEQRRQLDQLGAIGYLGGVVPETRSGVTVYAGEAAWNGANLYTSGHDASAILMDMDGVVLHEWHFPFESAFPRGTCATRLCDYWRRVRLLPDGSLLAVFDGHGIIEIDKNSRLIWASDVNAHHDLEVLPDGRVLVLTREPKIIPEVDAEHFTLEDFISVLDTTGKEVERFSIYEALSNSPWKDVVSQGTRPYGDIFHTNTLHVLDGSIADRVPAFGKDDILLSMNYLGTIAVWDHETRAISWVYRIPPQGQHDPQVLENGHVLFFDNRSREFASRVVELDPASREVVWEYHGTKDAPFFSASCGTVQRLPNGNTLISETDGGRAFEVDPAGQIVWEYYNPEQVGEERKLIACLFGMIRLPWDQVEAWLPD